VENRFLGILWVDYVGADNKISADELALRFQYAYSDRELPTDVGKTVSEVRRLNPKDLADWKRNVREMQNHLLFRDETFYSAWTRPASWPVCRS
jgi:hypothetical protein